MFRHSIISSIHVRCGVERAYFSCYEPSSAVIPRQLTYPYTDRRWLCPALSRVSLQFATINAKEDKLAPLEETLISHSLGHELSPPNEPSKKQPTKEVEVPPNDATADFAIVCTGGQLSAHNSVLLANCPYFEQAFRFAVSVSLDSLICAP
ncbi:hypothetical protein DE146DRAFT_330588 [Phaeosphaeria sp. MPI-PUGE-AT-0046c]|nr:hypothetical protein DE146DRAFT_330588 [Phaeosphaeria sp. MPI-PUGE-AT-0046c]